MIKRVWMLWFLGIILGFCICSCTSEPIEESVKSEEYIQPDPSPLDSGMIEVHQPEPTETIILPSAVGFEKTEEMNALQKKFYEDGQLKEEAVYKGGVKNGPFRSWFSNGQIKIRGTMENDRWNGMYEEWYEDGTPRIVGQYVKGRQHGEWCFFNSKGMPMPSLLYDAGQEVTRELPNLIP